MEFLKSIFGDKALTYEELQTALKDNKEVKLVNLADGQYVDKKKLDTKITELATANTTIQTLQETVKKFDGVDVEKLKQDVTNWEQKYNSDISNIKKDSAIEMAIMQAKGRNPKAIKALLDLDKISLKEDGTIEGLDLESLKETDSYLFDVETKSNIGTGFNPGEGNGNNEDLETQIAQALGVK